jgi:uncharacterized protein (TIGR03435 family)
MMAGGKMMRFGCIAPDAGRFECTGMPLRALLVRAYGVKTYQVSGPSWMDSERFDVRAKVPPDTTPDQVNLMLQKLIADRFRMTIHRETKELPIYALVLGKNGHKLKTPNPDDKEPPIDAVMAGRGAPPPPPPPPGGGEGGGRAMMVMAGGGPGGRAGKPGQGMMMSMRSGLFELIGKKTTVSSLADMLGNLMDRPVLDQTEIKGDYDFTLDFAPDGSMGRGGPMGGMMAGPGAGGAAPGADTPEPSGAPSIFSAIQSQLGLKLEPKKGPVDMIVIDKAEKVPTEN